jgi:ATP-dependent helicase Lhr and Lhr-like helicase
VDKLRQVASADKDGELLRLSATDPLNLVGIILPGPRIPAVGTNVVVLRDGIPVDQETDLASDAAGG